MSPSSSSSSSSSSRRPSNSTGPLPAAATAALHKHSSYSSFSDNAGVNDSSYNSRAGAVLPLFSSNSSANPSSSSAAAGTRRSRSTSPHKKAFKSPPSLSPSRAPAPPHSKFHLRSRGASALGPWATGRNCRRVLLLLVVVVTVALTTLYFNPRTLSLSMASTSKSASSFFDAARRRLASWNGNKGGQPQQQQQRRPVVRLPSTVRRPSPPEALVPLASLESTFNANAAGATAAAAAKQKAEAAAAASAAATPSSAGSATTATLTRSFRDRCNHYDAIGQMDVTFNWIPLSIRMNEYSDVDVDDQSPLAASGVHVPHGEVADDRTGCPPHDPPSDNIHSLIDAPYNELPPHMRNKLVLLIGDSQERNTLTSLCGYVGGTLSLIKLNGSVIDDWAYALGGDSRLCVVRDLKGNVHVWVSIFHFGVHRDPTRPFDGWGAHLEPGFPHASQDRVRWIPYLLAGIAQEFFPELCIAAGRPCPPSAPHAHVVPQAPAGGAAAAADHPPHMVQSPDDPNLWIVYVDQNGIPIYPDDDAAFGKSAASSDAAGAAADDDLLALSAEDAAAAGTVEGTAATDPVFATSNDLSEKHHHGVAVARVDAIADGIRLHRRSEGGGGGDSEPHAHEHDHAEQHNGRLHRRARTAKTPHRRPASSYAAPSNGPPPERFPAEPLTEPEWFPVPDLVVAQSSLWDLIQWLDLFTGALRPGGGAPRAPADVLTVPGLPGRWAHDLRVHLIDAVRSVLPAPAPALSSSSSSSGGQRRKNGTFASGVPLVMRTTPLTGPPSGFPPRVVAAMGDIQRLVAAQERASGSVRGVIDWERAVRGLGTLDADGFHQNEWSQLAYAQMVMSELESVVYEQEWARRVEEGKASAAANAVHGGAPSSSSSSAPAAAAAGAPASAKKKWTRFF
ncbi:hypothetical protein DFJ73DRAFT_764147 [Zopfochytrium polystomum]|nr:hypothetical protein DFJ73DRAFT_764147 [Zopfochytrium polystomum]